MTLDDVVKNIDLIDEDLTIYQKNLTDRHSEVILRKEEADGGLVLTIDGHQYHYLLEIFIAKEVIEGLAQFLNRSPTDAEKADRVFEYGINDA